MSNYDLSGFGKKTEKVISWFQNEASLVRTGRASSAIIENIPVDYYGTKRPLKSVASIGSIDARTLSVKPWDTDSILPIQQAVAGANLGMQAIPDKDIVRVVFPELNAERRASLLKILKDKSEEARVSLRRERDEVWRDIQDKERKGEMPEDDKFRLKDELQKIIDRANDKIQEIFDRKEKEVLG